MLIIGLTGGIASGKSTTAGFFRARNIPVHDSDAAVHSFMAPNGLAIVPVTEVFGRSVINDDGAVDRAILGAMVFNDPTRRQQLEQILHPMVAADRDAFLQQNRAQGEGIVVLDVPLLFETGGDATCDYIVVTATDDATQQQRIMQRPGMTSVKMDGILASQMPLAEKIKRADLVLDTVRGLDQAQQDLYHWLDHHVIAGQNVRSH